MRVRVRVRVRFAKHKTNRSRLNQLGSVGENFMKSDQRTCAKGAQPRGIPGCPEFAYDNTYRDKSEGGREGERG